MPPSALPSPPTCYQSHQTERPGIQPPELEGKSADSIHGKVEPELRPAEIEEGAVVGSRAVFRSPVTDVYSCVWAKMRQGRMAVLILYFEVKWRDEKRDRLVGGQRRRRIHQLDGMAQRILEARQRMAWTPDVAAAVAAGSAAPDIVAAGIVAVAADADPAAVGIAGVDAAAAHAAPAGREATAGDGVPDVHLGKLPVQAEHTNRSHKAGAVAGAGIVEEADIFAECTSVGLVGSTGRVRDLLVGVVLDTPDNR
jgi:hypothetical protein